MRVACMLHVVPRRLAAVMMRILVFGCVFRREQLVHLHVRRHRCRRRFAIRASRPAAALPCANHWSCRCCRSCVPLVVSVARRCALHAPHHLAATRAVLLASHGFLANVHCHSKRAEPRSAMWASCVAELSAKPPAARATTRVVERLVRTMQRSAAAAMRTRSCGRALPLGPHVQLRARWPPSVVPASASVVAAPRVHRHLLHSVQQLRRQHTVLFAAVRAGQRALCAQGFHRRRLRGASVRHA